MFSIVVQYRVLCKLRSLDRIGWNNLAIYQVFHCHYLNPDRADGITGHAPDLSPLPHPAPWRRLTGSPALVVPGYNRVTCVLVR